MSKLQINIILLIFGLISCNSPERNSEKITINENIKTNPLDKDTALMDTVIRDSQLKVQKTDTVLIRPSSLKKKRIMKNEKPEIESKSTMNDPSIYIIPGSIRNTFTKSNDDINFIRIVKNDEDRRIGCSGGGNSLSFTVKTSRDTFFFENEMLKSLNLKYSIQGGIYISSGESPNKGSIKGILLFDKSWQVEINVWINMKDMQNRENETQLILNENFTH